MDGSNRQRYGYLIILGLTFNFTIINVVQLTKSDCRHQEAIQVFEINSDRTHVAAKNDDVNVKAGVHFIGERHSGTNWIVSHLEQCFAHNIPVTPVMSRFKHWFQVDEPGESKYGLVIAQFRNVYDWVLAMNEIPHHALGHWNVERRTPLPWREFVTRPWTFDPRKYDRMRNYTKTIKLYEEGRIDKTSLNDIDCMDNFKWKEVIPCTMKDRKVGIKLAPFAGPLYELNREHPGVPYENIFEMRRDKIINFRREVPNFDSLENYIPVRYEDMIQNGTSELIRLIESKMNVKARCKPSPPKGIKHKTYPKGFVEWVNEHVDWDTEALVGYAKLDIS